MKDKKICIAMNLGGISNRVKCLVSMWRLADLYDREVILEWHENHTCGCKFRDLFENDIKEISEEELKKIEKSKADFFGDNLITLKNSEKEYMICGTPRLLLTPEELSKYFQFKEGGIEFQFSNIPSEIRENILDYLNKLKIKKNLQREINNFIKKNKLNEMVGIHIRRGDFADRLTSPGRVSSDEKFIERMNELIEKNSKIKFFLCTDSKEVEEKMNKEFPGRIIKFPKSSFVRTDVRATQEGLIDLILLSKTKQILGTYKSTFTEMAWWFGNCKPKTEFVIDPEKQKEYFRNCRRQNRKIIPKIKRMILKILGRKYL